MRNGAIGRLVAGLAALAAVLGSGGPAPRAQGGPQVLLHESFRQPTTTAAVLTLSAGAPGLPCLTAGPSAGASTVANCGLALPDLPGDGALRFTTIAEQQASGVVATTSLPTAQGLSIVFTQHQYGGYGLGGPGSPGGADGIAFFLAVAPPHPQQLGPQGGALGYASAGSSAGLPGGWLGIGLDAFGNYSNPAFGGPECPVPAWAGFTPDAVTVRGPGHGTNGYCLLESSANPIANARLAADDVVLAANVPGGTLRGDDRPASARRVRVDITPDDGLYRVYVDAGAGYDLAVAGTLPAEYYDPTTGALVNGLPPRITFGFSAATGSATDIHEIVDLTATTVTGAVPVLELAKTTTLSTAPQPGQGFAYVITPRVAGTVVEAAPLSLRVTDALPAGVSATALPSGTSWLCAPTSPAAFACRYQNPAPIAPGTTLPAITVPVMIDSGVAAGTSIVNTATVLSDDAAAPVSATAGVTVATAPPALTITTTAMPGGTVGAAYTTTLAAGGGAGTRTWSVSAGALPGGLTLSAGGVVGGTPTASGTFAFTARVIDTSGADEQVLSIVVAPATAPGLAITTTSPLPPAEVGARYTLALAATGGTQPYRWSLPAEALPPGLRLTAAGVIAGVPTAPGGVAFTVRVTDAQGRFVQRRLWLPVRLELVVFTETLPDGRVGLAYRAVLNRRGGLPPVTWSIVAGTLPPGLTLAADGVLSGVPAAAGTFAFWIRVADSLGGADSRRFTVTIARPEKAYVARGGACPGGPGPCINPLSLDVIDTASGAITRSISIPNASSVAGLTASPDGSRVYLMTWTSANTTFSTLHEIDTATDAVRRTRQVAGNRGAVVAAPDGTTIYALTYTPVRGVSVFDTATLSERWLFVTDGAGSLAVSPDSRTLYLLMSRIGVGGVAGAAGVYVLDAATGTLRAQIPTGAAVPQHAAITPNGARLWLAANVGSPASRLIEITTATNRVVSNRAMAEVGDVVMPGNTSLWIANRSAQAVTQHTTPSLAVVGSTAVPGAPWRLALSPDRRTIFAILNGPTIAQFGVVAVPASGAPATTFVPLDPSGGLSASAVVVVGGI